MWFLLLCRRILIHLHYANYIFFAVTLEGLVFPSVCGLAGALISPTSRSDSLWTDEEFDTSRRHITPSSVIMEDFDRGLLELRRTPNFIGRSPVQMLYGLTLRTCYTCSPSVLYQEVAS